MDSPVIEYIHETGLTQFLGTSPGSNNVDVLPWLDRLPLFLKPSEREGRAKFKRGLAFCVERLERLQWTQDRSAISESFLGRLLDDKNNLGFADKREAACLALTLIIGAADTSQISTWSFLEAMLEFPDVQRKGGEEIDMVVGDRTPVFEDLDRIPYVRYLVKETWPWRPPVALGHPHITTRELTYSGVRLPKDSRINLNASAIHRDPVRYPDSKRFWPERFADDLTTTMQSINASDVRQGDHTAFGSGCRVRPGYNVAERSLAVAILRILWAFEIKPGLQAELPLDPYDYRAEMPGQAGTDLPVTLVPRPEDKVRIVSETFKGMKEKLVPLEPL